MAQAPLQTAGETFRRRLHYERSAIGVMGTWNADASFANLKDNDFTDVSNLRMQTIGGWELRSAYKKYTGADYSSLEVLAKAEYRFKSGDTDALFDMTVYQTDKQIKVCAINRGVITGSLTWGTQYRTAPTAPPQALDLPGFAQVTTVTDTIINGANPPAIAAAYQYGSYLIVTVFGFGTFAVYPTDALADNWVVLSLGKNLATTPWQVRFADSTTGDMFLVQYTEAQEFGSVSVADRFQPVKVTDKSSPQAKLLPPVAFSKIPLGMKYWRSDYRDATRNFDNSEHKFFVWSPDDPTTHGPRVRDRNHLQTRAWGYRFVQVRTYIDAKGNKIKFRSNPSVDIWVQDTIYCPPQVYRFPATDPLGQVGTLSSQFGNIVIAPPGGGQDRWYMDVYPESQGLAKPSAQDMADLATLYIKYQGKPWSLSTVYTQTSNTSGLDDDTWRYAAWWMGFRKCAGTLYEDVDYTNSLKNSLYWKPWITEIPASVLKGAPMTFFKFTDFSTTDGTTVNPDFPSDVESIEVYRTAWSDGDDKLSDGDPAFQPHLYGYVGAIKKDGTFTDDIADLDIDFSLTPDTYDGFLTGQFSGQVIREYNNKLAIGNCSTSYEIFSPWSHAPLVPETVDKSPFQFFVLDDLSNLASATGLYTDLITFTPPDHEPIVWYGLQYVDSEGNASEIVRLICDTSSQTDLTDFLHYSDAYIVTPVGYDPSITAINVWFSIYSGGVRNYVLVKTLTPNDASIHIHYDDVKSGPFVAPVAKVVKTIIENGELIWSKTNEMFDWPPLNSRVVSKTASITALESVVGELMVFSDTRIDYDNISIINPRGEEVTKWVGSVGRWTYCKVDKVVFFLSANGLFFGEPGGVVPFPGNVQTVVLSYLREQITGVADMANAKRATLGYNAKRYELWLHFPSSGDLGGVLPEVTIVYKFFNPDITKASIANFVNYHFDLRLASDAAVAPNSEANKPIFLTTSDGKLFVSYTELNGLSYRIATIDEDTAGVWTDPWALEHAYGLGEMNLMKILREVTVAGDFLGSDVSLRTSNPNPAGAVGFSFINPSVPVHNFTIPASGNNITLKHRTGGTTSATASIIETTSYAPIVRIEKKTGGTNGIVNIKAIDALYWILHNHPN